ncbi:MAG TPA: helix-turn-helix domain-containing protein [Clostridiales bacterium]|nr:helix-turn-helix domain-containing protein [Clostridiales bacterium]
MAQDDRLEMLSLLRELHNISGFRISIHDVKFNEIEAYPKSLSPYCTLIQSTGDGRRMCLENDRRAFEQVSTNPEVYLYKCCFGLYEAVAPLYILGNVVGYLMMGQSIDGSPESRELIIKSAEKLVGDKKAIEKAAQSVHVCSKDKILSCMKILDVCAQYITLSNRFQLNKSHMSDKVKEYLENHYNEDITIDSLCLKFFCSRTNLMTSFKANYGVGIIEYLTHVRIQKAKQLLCCTSKTVKEIAEECGYSDQNYFSKVFLKHCGITPTAYRKKKAVLL